MFLINKSGKIVGVSESKVDDYLRQGFTKVPTGDTDHLSSLINKDKLKVMSKTGVPVYMLTSIDKPDGYGQSQAILSKYLIKNGIGINKKDVGQNIGMCYFTPVFAERLNSPIKVLYTMFESTTIPTSWVKHLEKADKVFVPSKFCQKAFKTKGIDTEVIPLGYNHEVYKFIERPEHKVFTFLHYNAFNMRKGFDLVFKAFTEEFGDNPNVKMVFKTIHTRPPFPILPNQYPNIEVIKEEYSNAQMLNLLKDADAFVFPSRGEGFGLTPLEALATGLPVLIPNSSGMTEYFDKDYFYEIDVEGECPSLYQQYDPKDVGNMVEPSLESLKKQMRYVYEHREEAKEKGTKGAEWVKKWTVDNTAKLLAKELKILNETIMPVKIPDIAFLTEDIAFYSGGRYHSWLQALMLTDSKWKVKVYTNGIPIFKDDFDLYQQPEIEIVGHDEGNEVGGHIFETLDVQANAYFGSPAIASMGALRLGLKYKKPVYVTMFDPPTWVEQSKVTLRDELQRDYDLKAFLDKHLKELVDFKLIVLTENSIDDYAKWYGLDKKYIVAVHPAVNSKLISLFDRRVTRERQKHIVTISRNHPRKGFKDILMAFHPYCHEYILHIITSTEEGIYQQCAKIGIPANRVIVHSKITDLEKFRIMADSKVLLSGSKFEGFGMWCTEARAMGLPVVCYDIPAIEDIYNDEGMFKAKLGDSLDLCHKLGKALESKPLEPKTDHYFEVIQKKLLEVVKPLKIETPDNEVIPMYIVLNEQKFIGASLRSVLKRKEVSQVTIVEGADKKYPRATDRGLSIDDTALVINEVQKEFPNKEVIYYQMGWVSDKKDLRNKAIELSKQSGWGLFVDADEVWSDTHWNKLINTMKENRSKGVIYFKHLHFWKDLNTIAVGSQWDSYLFRCFRFAEKGLEIKQHASEPVTKSGIPVGEKYGRVTKNDIKVHHYATLKNAQDIYDKLDYYKKRDTNLTVRDTWTNYKEGDETQWTTKGGTVKKFTGNHPKEIIDVL